jgi:hypothetical protein
MSFLKNFKTVADKSPKSSKIFSFSHFITKMNRNSPAFQKSEVYEPFTDLTRVVTDVDDTVISSGGVNFCGIKVGEY